MIYLLLASIAGKFASEIHQAMEKRNVPFKAIFVTTAANIYSDKPWMENDIAMIETGGIQLSRVDFATMNQTQIKNILAQTSALIVGGGNPLYLLEVIQARQVLPMLRDRIKQGMLYIGSSAGAVLASKSLSLETLFEDRPSAKKQDNYEGLCFNPFNLLPHWGDKSMYEEYIEYVTSSFNSSTPLISLTNNQALEIIDSHYKIITLTE